MKKGFTLVEMIAVILIIALISITSLPAILNQVSNKQKEISDVSKQIIYDSLEQYLSSKTTTYPKVAGNTYCITLNELVENGKLSSPVKDLETGNEIALNTVIQATLNVYSDYEYCIVGYDKDENGNLKCNSCTETRN